MSKFTNENEMRQNAVMSNKASESASRNTAKVVIPQPSTEKLRIITVRKPFILKELDSSCFTFANDDENLDSKIGTANKDLLQS